MKHFVVFLIDFDQLSGCNTQTLVKIHNRGELGPFFVNKDKKSLLKKKFPLAEKQETNCQITRVSTQKQIPHAKLRT